MMAGMRAAALLSLFALASAPVDRRGDSVYGRVTAVSRADLVVFTHAAGEYNLRLVGIVAPAEARSAAAATDFVRLLVLGKAARMRLEGRNRNGELRARLFTADAATGIQDVSVALVRAGLVRKLANYDFKYGELAAAEREARAARRGLWAVRR
jgi:endonuclease YncB( thermonuclease family)